MAQLSDSVVCWELLPTVDLHVASCWHGGCVGVCVCNLCGREELLRQAYEWYMGLVLAGSTKPAAPQIAA